MLEAIVNWVKRNVIIVIDLPSLQNKKVLAFKGIPSLFYYAPSPCCMIQQVKEFTICSASRTLVARIDLKDEKMVRLFLKLEDNLRRALHFSASTL